jgi:hypothetical protein
VVAASGGLLVSAASAQPFIFSTNSPDGKIAMATNPSSAGNLERETGDDFILNTPTAINQAIFTGLITGSSTSFNNVVTEIYRVFPKDSVDPPSGNVPTRNNSPSDVAFVSRDLSSPGFTVSMQTLGTFTAANSVLNGIFPKPNFHTQGEGAVTGQEVQFTVDFTTPLDLPADHYFFVPQVEVNGDGHFFWLSAPRPIVAPGTPFLPDLQAWIRNEDLAPDWLRVGTDIVGVVDDNPVPTFNAAFSLKGVEIPESSSGWVIAAALAIGVFVIRRKRRLTA